MLEGNKNADIGSIAEELFKNSIGDHLSVIDKIKAKYGIPGDFTVAIITGGHKEKCDVKMEFSGRRNIDANIKSFNKSGFNHLARTKVGRFCKLCDLEAYQANLEALVLQKSENTKLPLFREEDRGFWRPLIEGKVDLILKTSFSTHTSREILVLIDQKNNIIRLYCMADVLKKLDRKVTFTIGGFNVGSCISFQRKGGDGGSNGNTPKNSIKHTGNGVQLKIKCRKFIKEMENCLIAEYLV